MTKNEKVKRCFGEDRARLAQAMHTYLLHLEGAASRSDRIYDSSLEAEEHLIALRLAGLPDLKEVK